MTEGRVLGIQIFRALQILLAVLGLSFCIASKYLYWVLMMLYVITVIYLIMIIICILAGKSQLSNTIQAITEVLLGVFIIIYTIYTTTAQDKDIWLILTIVIGFILPALLFITAYEKT